MTIETEIKYLDADFKILKKQLADLGAQSFGRHFETNVLLDTADNRLYANQEMLRLRKQEWADKTRCVITFKKPLSQKATSAHASLAPLAQFKKREETEYVFQDFAAALLVFQKLGFIPWAHYEKVRESFRLPVPHIQKAGLKHPHVEIDLDLLSFMTAVEIEGEERLIKEAEKLLGLDKFKKSSTNYHKLHQEWRKQNCKAPDADFIFDCEQRALLRSEIGLPI